MIAAVAAVVLIAGGILAWRLTSSSDEPVASGPTTPTTTGSPPTTPNGGTTTSATTPPPGSLEQLIDQAIDDVGRLGDDTFRAAHYAWMADAIVVRRGWNDPLVAEYLEKVYALRNPDGGWGYITGTDAFQDDSENPADTTYSLVLTNHVGRVLLDGWRAGVVPEAMVEETISLVESFPTADVEGSPTADVPGSCIAYSTAAADHPYCVGSVNAAAALFLHRAAEAGFDVDRSRIDSMLAHEQAWMLDGPWWPYYSEKPTERQGFHDNAVEVEAFLELDKPTGEAALAAMRAETAPDSYQATALYRLAPYDCSLADPSSLQAAVADHNGEAVTLAELAYLGSLAARACPTS